MGEVRTILANDIEVADAKAQYDAEVKKILANKEILAWILKFCTDEFKGMLPEEIIPCIEGEPSIGEEPVYPGKQGRIFGGSTEDSMPNEGDVYFDILFYANALYHIFERVKTAPDHYTAEFIRAVGALYAKYYNFVSSSVTDWHLKSATPLPAPEQADSKILLDLLETCVEPTETMRNYAQFERNIATDASTEPLYALIALFPCYAFWPWLFWKYGTPADTNLYKGWIQSNQGGGSATLVDTLVENEWIKQGKAFDAALALSIMNKSMEYEVTMFTEAVPTGVSVLCV